MTSLLSSFLILPDPFRGETLMDSGNKFINMTSLRQSSLRGCWKCCAMLALSRAIFE